jgi:hypothetical protein
MPQYICVVSVRFMTTIPQSHVIKATNCRPSYERQLCCRSRTRVQFLFQCVVSILRVLIRFDAAMRNVVQYMKGTIQN